MNQILDTKLKSIKYSKSNILKKFFLYRLQFILSISSLFILILISIFYVKSLNNSENISNNILDNYNIYKLYSTNSSIIEKADNELFGIIEIPKLNIYYPIFSKLNENLLKISPCKFYGDHPNKNSNICIAGHNYNNSLFFSKINTLENNDEIYIYDSNGNIYVYFVFNIYEVINTDLSPIFDYDNNSKELTLITCNNLNNNRIIVKAKQKDF